MRLHRQESCRRFADRIKAILLLDAGLIYAQIAEALLFDNHTIRNFQTLYSEF